MYKNIWEKKYITTLHQVIAPKKMRSMIDVGGGRIYKFYTRGEFKWYFFA